MTAIPIRKEKKDNGCARGWSVRKGSLLQDHLPVKFQDVKFKDPKFKYEIFVRIDMKHLGHICAQCGVTRLCECVCVWGRLLLYVPGTQQ